MPATPADIARYTQDGIVVVTNSVTGAAIKAAHPDARDMGDTEFEFFFVSDAHAQAMLDEKFALTSAIDPDHVGVEVEEAIGIGVTIPIAPTVPSFRVIDDTHNLDSVSRVRSFANDTGTDRFALEVHD